MKNNQLSPTQVGRIGKMLQKCCFVAVGMVLVFLAGTGHAGVISYDLATDWSNVSNPNGAWSYEVGGGLGILGTRTGDPFSTSPPIWGTGGNTHLGWSQSNGTEQFTHDWSTGDIFGHTYASGISIAWMSPIAGTIDFSGGIWEGRDIGRSNNWNITLNGSIIQSGIIASGDAYDSFNPLLLSGTGISVLSGDILKLNFIPNGIGDYVVVDLNIGLTTSQISEPAVLWLLFIGFAGFLGLKRRRLS